MPQPSTPPALEVEDLTVAYRRATAPERWLEAVRNVSLRIDAGQTYGLVGESGSGKSTLALAVMRYLPPSGAVREGAIRLAGRDLLALDDAELRAVWRRQVKLVPQNPLTALNPAMRLGQQLAEALPSALPQAQAKERVLELLAAVGLADPARVAGSFPHRLSGGMQQRVMIAMALAGEPQLLVLDEPTTNLDVTTEATILDLLRGLVSQRNTAVLYVSHNLAVVAGFCNRVAVLYAGELVEDIAVAELGRGALHPYTLGLLASVPRVGLNKRTARLTPIPGAALTRLEEAPAGCVFAPRCAIAVDRCQRERPPLERPAPDRLVRCWRWPEVQAGAVVVATQPSSAPAQSLALPAAAPVEVLALRNVRKYFPLRRSLGQVLRGEPGPAVRAVDSVDVAVGKGLTLGLVGESGSGKTTLACCVAGLLERSSGDVLLAGLPLSPGLAGRSQDVLARLQMVFQNPDEALNPYRSVGDALTRPLVRLAGLSQTAARQRAVELLAAVKLSPAVMQRLPEQLSGGEKQRVAIARAFASHPEVLILDEAVSALDVSVQAAILNLLNDLQSQQASAYLFISHDLAVVAYLADAVAVMYLGQIVESGPTEQLIRPPYHPYTEALLSAAPLLDAEPGRLAIRLAGDAPSAAAVPAGCRFHTRCPRRLGEVCATSEPPWRDAGNGHRIRCHIPLDELSGLQRRVFGSER